jgi:chromate transporter
VGKQTLGWGEISRIFLRVGARSFGGWSTTSLLLEKELVTQRKVISKAQLHGAVAYAQILPGATQVAIVSNTGYKLRGVPGAFLATACYSLPALSLITLFAVLYFHYAQGPQFVNHLGGLIAALGGVIFANAYNIGKRHVTHPALWLFVAAAFVARLIFGVNAVLVIIGFGAVGLLSSWVRTQRQRS